MNDQILFTDALLFDCSCGKSAAWFKRDFEIRASRFENCCSVSSATAARHTHKLCRAGLRAIDICRGS